MLQELAELGMALARAAAQQALAESATPPTPATQAQPPCAPRAEPPGEPAPPRPLQPALLFARLSSEVRAVIALAARIRAAHEAGRSPLADPRHAPIRAALHQATENHPKRPVIRRVTEERLRDDLANDPFQTLSTATILATIREDFHLDDPEPPDG